MNGSKRLSAAVRGSMSSARLAAALVAALLVVLVVASLLRLFASDSAFPMPWLQPAVLVYRRTARLAALLGLSEAFLVPWYLALVVSLFMKLLACDGHRPSRRQRVLAQSPAIVRT